ncbi:MAG TPA: LuxR C-terminal-related transcriptional regulator [Acidimicrobiales bacterium]|nr:LuxR C-terminal-related transcriptional regulator [Acidimicrobiales bacterium]
MGGSTGTAPVVVGVLDAKWRVQRVSADVAGLLGYEPAECTGTDVFEAVHPDDSATLMVRLGQAMESQRAERLRLRLWHKRDGWSPTSILLSPLAPEDPFPLGFVATSAELAPERDLEDRVAVLELRLHNIAAEVQAAGIYSESVVRGVSARARELSARQHEILSRLAAGQRVATIARDLGVSASTVRNHLSQIFRKLGVRSQAELLEALRGSGNTR